MPDFILTITALIVLSILFLFILQKKEKEKIEFFHVMAHRFRSPISIIKWYTELLSDKSVGDLNEKQKQYFTEVYNSSEKLNETIESLIILLQIQSKTYTCKSEKVDFKLVIERILRTLRFKIERHGIELIKDYPENEKFITTNDSRLVTIALESLIENAIRFSPEKGKVEIKIYQQNNYLTIEIRDHGYGIPKDRKTKILAESVNSKDMGFSLYLVKLAMKKLNAKINFISEENIGTTFYLYFPL